MDLFRSRLRAILLVIPLTLFAPGRELVAAPRLVLPVQEFRLANGLRVIFAPDESLPDITVSVRYGVGAGDDPPGLEGLAHLVEHLEFARSRHVPLGGHARILELAGAVNVNGATDFDSTVYTDTIPPERLELALWLESDRMGFLVDGVDEALVRRERQILRREDNFHAFDQQFGFVVRLLGREFFPGWHPYHLPDDPQESLSDIRIEDVRAFLRTWYTPSNATIAIAGRFEPAFALELVTRYFGTLESHDPPRRPALPSEWPLDDREIHLGTSRVRTTVQAIWSIPTIDERGKGELELARTMLTGPGGLLTRGLVGGGIALQVDAAFYSWYSASIFIIVATLDRASRAQDAQSMIDGAVAQLSNGVDGSSFLRARDLLTERRWLRLETSAGRASRLIEAAPGEDRWGLSSYDSLDAAALSRDLQRYLVPNRRLTIVAHQIDSRFPYGSRTVVTRPQKRVP